jgi:dephospho-CoA kinase
MLKIGLTGGIGSGKSTVARIFQVLKVPVFFADMAAKKVMNEDETLKQQLITVFGAETYKGNILNNTYLAAKVFKDEQQLALLNSLVHPATIRAAEQWFLEQEKQQVAYVIKEAALLFEAGATAGLDFIVGVSAPEQLRIQRTVKRDNVSVQEVKLRMLRQIDETIKMKLCDFVIVNDEQQMIIPQVLDLHEQFLSLSKQAFNTKISKEPF